jgi:hypothetical protein
MHEKEPDEIIKDRGEKGGGGAMWQENKEEGRLDILLFMVFEFTNHCDDDDGEKLMGKGKEGGKV